MGSAVSCSRCVEYVDRVELSVVVTTTPDHMTEYISVLLTINPLVGLRLTRIRNRCRKPMYMTS